MRISDWSSDVCSSDLNLSEMGIVSFKFRIRLGERHLRRKAVACNKVWNFCVATQREAKRRWKGDRRVRWPSAFDLDRLTKSVAAEIGIHSDTVTPICRKFAKNGDQHRRCQRYRSSSGGKRSLGWIHFLTRAKTLKGTSDIYLQRRSHF